MLPSFLRKLLIVRRRSVGKIVTPQSVSDRETLGLSTTSGDTPLATHGPETVEENAGNSLFSFVDLKDPFTPSSPWQNC
jgi:hypothetical protein